MRARTIATRIHEARWQLHICPLGCNHYRIAPSRLGGIKCLVGPDHQLKKRVIGRNCLRMRFTHVIHSNTDAYSYPKGLPLVYKRMGRYGLTYAVGKVLCLSGICTDGEHHKFLAAIARKQVGLPHTCSDDFGNTLQNHVAYIVPVYVINFFKVVYIQHDT